METLEKLLAAKLLVPPRTLTFLGRPRLIDRLSEGLRRKVLLIAAPAGWGKTTLLSAWAAMTPPDSLAWVSFDSGDNDPSRFWAYVISALQQIRPASANSP